MKSIPKFIFLLILCLILTVVVSSSVLIVTHASNNTTSGISDKKLDREAKSSTPTEIGTGYSVTCYGDECESILPDTELYIPHETLIDFTIYNSVTQNYSFHHPASWQVYDRPDNLFPYLRIENFDSRGARSQKKGEDQQYFKIEVVTLPNDKNLVLSEWIKELVTTSHPLPEVVEQKSIQVAGLPAIYQLERVGSFVHPVVYVQKNENVYLINILNSDSKFKIIVDNFLESFSFNL